MPQVIAYWWKSPSIARWAASISSRGGGKFGIPWARLMPSYWLLTRVISRITDSVKPWTRLEIMRRGRLAGRYRPPAMAGTMETSSPCLSVVVAPWRNRMSSWLM